jgi:Ca2+-binding EF-hand superfamily protein
MSSGRVVTFTALTVALAAQLAAAPTSAQSRFAQPQPSNQGMRFSGMDRNNDGVITRQEWRGSDDSFRVHDWNGDGILSGEEVRRGGRRPGQRSDNVFDLPDENMDIDREDRFENLDVNQDGRIQASEWHGSEDAFEWLDRNNDGTLSRAEVVGSERQARPRAATPVGTMGTAAQGDCVPNAARLVDDIYQQVLERSADRSSAPLTEGLAAGRLTIRDIVRQVASSPEHGERFFWQPAVRTLYQRLLGREPDPQGLRTYTDMARREGIPTVRQAIVGSDEYRRHAAARTATPADDTAAYEAGVRLLYRHLLGRDADPEGLQNLTAIAARDGFDAVIDRIISSEEYERLFGNDVVPGRGARYCGPTKDE